MALSPIKHKKPVMGLLDWPYGETCTSGGNAGDPWRAFCMARTRKQQIQHHIQFNDYFGTLATVIDLVRQALQKDLEESAKLRRGQIKTLNKLKNDLMFLQNNYQITKKTRS
jgi:hypothetical protein